jgi:uncharacterized protein YuzE
MKYEYDKEVDGLYIWFNNILESGKEVYENEIWPDDLKNEIGLLFDSQGHLLGLEILPASKYFEQRKLDEFGKDSYL